MDLINWSLHAIDTIFSTRSLGSGEPACPAGTFAAGYTMDAWEKWLAVCLAVLSMEDIEDIYLFGTMITGLLLIGLGIALVYRGNQKTVAAVQSPIKLPDMIEAVGRAVGTQTVTIQNLNHTVDSILEKLMALQREMDHFGQNGQAGYPDPEVVWYKDDQPIKETRHFQIDYDEEGNCSLVISDVSGDDDAKYACKAVNSLGEAICTAELIVEIMGGDEEEEEEEE